MLCPNMNQVDKTHKATVWNSYDISVLYQPCDNVSYRTVSHQQIACLLYISNEEKRLIRWLYIYNQYISLLRELLNYFRDLNGY